MKAYLSGTLNGAEHTCCGECQARFDAAQRRIEALEAELRATRAQLREALKLADLQKADLDRLRDLYERTRPNCPERVLGPEAQLAFERVLEALHDVGAANDTKKEEPSANQESAPPSPPDNTGKRRGRRHAHGRRRLDLTNLPVESVHLDPPEVTATDGKGWKRIGQEVSERIAFRPASYFRLRVVRGKWAPETESEPIESASSQGDIGPSPSRRDPETPVLIAPIPDSVWPSVMADPSAIAQIILSKYDDVLPLHRQERISVRHGFALPRSTQCGWLTLAHENVYRVVDAMLAEACRSAHCIATDATSAPVRAVRGSTNWHIFVLIADRDHIVFRHAREHSGASVRSFLKGFHGHLLADAAPIYDVLYREEGMTEIACWFHCRRYFWKALETERELAMEALSLIAKLFEVDGDCQALTMPHRTTERARRCEPILALLDAWVARHRGKVDARGKLAKAIGYYDNQRAALRRFLDDGRLSLDNGGSERELRNLVMGRHNWGSFANETGLEWYTVFRSLIASCALHGLNAQEYIESLLRLAPHWSVTRMIELSPKHWAKTIAGLDARMRAILVRPWEKVEARAEVASAA